MQTLLEVVLVLVLLLLVFRVSLTKTRHAINLRGGIHALNILCGLLGAALVACLLRDALRRRGFAAPEPLSAAVIHLLPVVFAVVGGLAGFLLLGAVWRRLFQNGPASARTWLRRAEFAIAIASGLGLLSRLLH